MEMSNFSIRKLTEMREVLQDPTAAGPEEVYFMIRGKPNITVLVPGKLGEEFCKTYGHYHFHDEPEHYKVLHGEGIFLFQKKGENEAAIEDVQIKKVKAGETVEVPKGYAHLMINTGNEFLITADDAPTDAETKMNDYEPIRKMQGFCYYIVEENGEMKFIKNPRYKKVPEAK